MTSPLQSIRLNRQVSLSEQVYVALRRSILTGVIKPGERIDEKAIATSLDISRTPVREAIKRLSDELLVTVVAQSATRASQLQAATIREAYLIRRALEMESAMQAAQIMTPQQGEKLNRILDRQSLALKHKQHAEAIDIDDEFHRYIAGISDLHRLWRVIEVSKAQLDRCRHLVAPRVGQGEKTIEQHQQIMLALQSNNPDAAKAAMQSHLDFAYESAAVLLEQSELEFPEQPKLGGRAGGRSSDRSSDPASNPASNPASARLKSGASKKAKSGESR